ncbi:MAG TPA: carbohydrate ABC transporter permease [Candidatus Ornithomonoglobus intestinigallinarum]|uniref:Carbohydrate ABC transporter permease n=1 Tax=Candidatus Ornithomonoglobus intestinigallinarum TaxID=2840894 RepID=A0A9D1H1L6_9FIRM|nr:carbohydrate ABC transporter permease [Candidatus Ornithomonoglobus intestinigallinarum]
MLTLKRKTLGDWIGEIIIYLVLTILAVVMVIPFIYVIAASFAPESEIQSRPIFLVPENPTLSAYEDVFSGSTGTRVIQSLAVSVGVTLCGTLINLFFTLTMAYGLSRTNLIGKKALLNMVLFTMVVNGGMIPTFLLVKNLGMYDTFSALILPGAISAYNMLIVRNFFIELPNELEEAASIDGCSDIGIFIKIALPLSMPVIATFGLFYAVGHWNNYFGALLYLEDQAKYPFQLVLRNIVMQTADTSANADQELPEDTLKMAVIVIGTVPILCVYPFLQKHFAAGVMVGAVKG